MLGLDLDLQVKMFSENYNTIILSGDGPFIQHVRDFDSVERRHNLIHKEQIINIFKKILNLNISIYNIFDIKIGMGSAVFKIQTDDQIYALKTFLFLDTHSPLQEYLFNKIIQKNILIQNKIVLFDFSKKNLPYPYIISYWLQGKSLFELSITNSNITELYKTFSQIGTTIKTIHNECTEIRIRKELNTFNKKYKYPINWSSFINNNIQGGTCLNLELYKVYILESDIRRFIDSSDYHKVLRLINNINGSNLTYGYLHGDVSLLNFYFEDQVLVGILDGGLKFGYHYEELVNFYVFLYNIKFFQNNCDINYLFNAFLKSYKHCDKKALMDRNIFNFFLIYKVLKRLTTIFKVKRYEEYEFYRKFLVDHIKEIEIMF